MKTLATLAAIAATLCAPLAQAAQDPGLTLHDGLGGNRRIGLGARASVTIPLGAVRGEADRPILALDAGPAISRAGETVRVRDRVRIAGLARLALRPGYDASIALAGQPLVQQLSPAALRDRQGRLPEGERRNVSTLGGIGIAVGVLVLAAGITALVLIDEANDNSD